MRQPANTLQTNLAGRKWGFILSNREQRRKQAKSGKSQAERNKEYMELLQAESKLNGMLKEAFDKGQQAGFYRCLLVFCYELRNVYDFGEKRITRLVAKVVDLGDSLEQGLLNVDDIRQQLEDETGIQIKWDEQGNYSYSNGRKDD